MISASFACHIVNAFKMLNQRKEFYFPHIRLLTSSAPCSPRSSISYIRNSTQRYNYGTLMVFASPESNTLDERRPIRCYSKGANQEKGDCGSHVGFLFFVSFLHRARNFYIALKCFSTSYIYKLVKIWIRSRNVHGKMSRRNINLFRSPRDEVDSLQASSIYDRYVI